MYLPLLFPENSLLNQVLLNAQNALHLLTSDYDFINKIKLIFGESVDVEQAKNNN